MSDNKPVIFISYSHADEPERPADGEIKWLSFVQQYLQPAVKNGIFDLWVDRRMLGGVDWDPEIEQKLRACDIFILLVSTNSMASDYIIDNEIAIVRERQANGENVHFYPLLLTPTPDAGLNKVKDKNLRPRDARPFSSFSYHERLQHMTEAANEIGKIAEQIIGRNDTKKPNTTISHGYVHITGLPETAYEKLRGRDVELKRLDDAWADCNSNILSLIAEGGAGKSALLNEWLTQLRADNYRGAVSVLGWSFYSQGTKERATSAEQFLNWALDKLGIKSETTSATAKGEIIAEAMMKRRVLLLLDGCEPLQHGLDKKQGELKDQGLRALLRRFASTPPTEAHGLVVLTSRLSIKDIARWENGAAPIVNLEQLSDEAGVALLRDNGIWGTDKELRATVDDFGGHPLALGLLASFLKETQFGDVRRRDHIRAFFADPENPRHDHARRVMESYEKEWLVEQPVLLAIMYLIGLFDRPASGDCLQALREKPAIEALTHAIVDIDEGEWQRSVVRLRDSKLLSPRDPLAPDSLDAHPLVREWFSERLFDLNSDAWRAAHSRLYDHLRRATREGDKPSLEDLAPLYEAIAHGCRAGRHQDALDNIYKNRICRRRPDRSLEFYASQKLGAFGSDLAAISWFFDKPYTTPAATLYSEDWGWVLNQAAFRLRAQGRFGEALPAVRAALRTREEAKDWHNAAVVASNLSEGELLIGEVAVALAAAQQSVTFADRSGDEFNMLTKRVTQAAALHAAGRRPEAERLFVDAERRQKKSQPSYPLLYSSQGYLYCDLLLALGEWTAVRDRATQTLEWGKQEYPVLSRALDVLTIGRSHFGLVLKYVKQHGSVTAGRADARNALALLDEGIDSLRLAAQAQFIASGLLARAAFRRSVGDWDGVARDLDEVEEIAEPGPMKLILCDMALERTRLTFTRIEAFAPLNGLIGDGPPKPLDLDAAEVMRLKEEARASLATARKLITECGYHRRDEELAELEAVLHGERKFADLQPRV